MKCYRCNNLKDCKHPRYAFENNFEIEDCKNFKFAECYRYLDLAQNEKLMLLIYNYFTGEEELYSLYSKEEVEEIIKKAIKEL